jgi:penicillin-binding protein 1A
MLRLIRNFFIFLLVSSFAFALGLLFCLQHNLWIDFSVLENYNPGKPSILLDDAGQEWARFEMDRRRIVTLNEIPKHLIDAFLVSEDRDFFQHAGISWRGITRSIIVNLKHRKIVQGASTITQQLVKLLFFDSRKTFNRKIKEQLVALLVERHFTKEQILETYLNHVYFGCGIYGVEAAARRFFGKSASEMSLAESAALASIVKSPGQYCPLLCPLSCEQRRNLVLKQFAKQNLITSELCEQLICQPLQICKLDQDQIAPHLKELIRQFLENQFGKKALYHEGLIIKTTLNREIQNIAQTEFYQQFIKLKKQLGADTDGALITMDTKLGEIKALIGGFDFQASQYDRAMVARRQMGSIFKPIVYAASLQAGYDFAQVDVDEPIEVAFGNQIWRPRNNNRLFDGSMTFARALSFSNNIIAVKALALAGCGNVAKLAEAFHLPGPIRAYPSIALGCIDVTLSEATGAFNVFANDGVYVAPHYLKWVKNEWGTKIWRYEPVCERVLPSSISSQVNKVLGIGTERFLNRMGGRKLMAKSIGKTGTTNDSRTCWFAGSTPNLTTVLYLGRDNNQPLGKDIYPVWTLFPIWLNIYEKIIKTKQEFVYDPSLVEIEIDWVTGRKVWYHDENTVKILVPNQQLQPDKKG